MRNRERVAGRSWNKGVHLTSKQSSLLLQDFCKWSIRLIVLMLSGSGYSTKTRLASDLGLIHNTFNGSRGWFSETMGMWITILGVGPVLMVDRAQVPELPRVWKLITSPGTQSDFWVHGLKLGLQWLSILGHNYWDLNLERCTILDSEGTAVNKAKLSPHVT